jgi:hypothetical protein
VSEKTRIKRPTTATPKNLKRGTLVHVSTDYRWVPQDPAKLGPQMFVRVGPGTTYRKQP